MMGRRHRPTVRRRCLVEVLAASGVPQEHIARTVGVDAKTLRKHYRNEIDLGATYANTKVAARLFEAATGDGPCATAAAIFWLKCRAGWREADDSRSG